MFSRVMVCLRNISVDTLHKGDTDDDNDDDDDSKNNSNNNNMEHLSGKYYLLKRRIYVPHYIVIYPKDDTFFSS
jgi:hypothetical protein